MLCLGPGSSGFLGVEHSFVQGVGVLYFEQIILSSGRDRCFYMIQIRDSGLIAGMQITLELRPCETIPPYAPTRSLRPGAIQNSVLIGNTTSALRGTTTKSEPITNGKEPIIHLHPKELRR